LQKEIGKVLKRYRIEAKIPSQKKLAAQIGDSKHHGYVSRIETGRSPASLDFIEKWLAACGKDEKQFFHDVLDEYIFKKPE
jgi:transcriptional regulator with XRE-family HTH domain